MMRATSGSSATGSIATAPSSPCTTSLAARVSWRDSCRPSAWRTGCRFRRGSCISRVMQSNSTRFDLQMPALADARARLYPEFLLGGVPAAPATDGALQVRYSSGLDLLRQTPEFVRETRVQRLEGEFEHAYRYVEPLFAGKNPYLEAIDRNLKYLHRVLRTERWPMLRRSPPLFTSEETPIGQVRG